MPGAHKKSPFILIKGRKDLDFRGTTFVYRHVCTLCFVNGQWPAFSTETFLRVGDNNIFSKKLLQGRPSKNQTWEFLSNHSFSVIGFFLYSSLSWHLFHYKINLVINLCFIFARNNYRYTYYIRNNAKSEVFSHGNSKINHFMLTQLSHPETGRYTLI